MRPVAKWFVLTMTTSTERNNQTATEVESCSTLITQSEFPFNAKAPVIIDSYFRTHYGHLLFFVIVVAQDFFFRFLL